ncbi:MAG: porin PorA family protein [Actinomycetota bacterium]
MKGVTSKILIALGVILILGAILWWAIAVNALMKLPDNIEAKSVYEGEITYYVNPTTQEPLPPGEEMRMPLVVEREVNSLAEEYDSSRAVIEEKVKTTAAGIESPPGGTSSVYVLDRKSSENVNDERAYDFEKGNTVEREGNYYPLLPFDTSNDEKYPVWKAEVNEGLEAEFLSEEELEGVTVYNFRGALGIDARKEVTLAYIELLGLPLEVSFEQLKPQLVALGIDVDALLATATQVIGAESPEDLQALNAALQQSIPVKYYWAFEVEISVEPKTGSPVNNYKDIESLHMEVDTSGLAGIFTILAKYANDPVLGPQLAPLVQLQGQLGDAEPTKIFEYSIAQTEDTVKTAIEDAKDGAGQINLVKVYIPWALLIVGALILIIGLLVGGGQAPAQTEE